MKTLKVFLFLLCGSPFAEGYGVEYRQNFAGIEHQQYWGQLTQLSFSKEKYFTISSHFNLDIKLDMILSQGELLILQNSSANLLEGNSSFLPLDLNILEGVNHSLDASIPRVKLQFVSNQVEINSGRFPISWGTHLFFSPNEWWRAPSTELFLKNWANYKDGVQLIYFPNDFINIEAVFNRNTIEAIPLLDSLNIRQKKSFNNFGLKIESQIAQHQFHIQGAYLNEVLWLGNSWVYLLDPFNFNIEYSLEKKDQSINHRSLTSLQFFHSKYGIYQVGYFLNNIMFDIESTISQYSPNQDPSLLLSNGSIFFTFLFNHQQMQWQYIFIQNFEESYGINSLNLLYELSSEVLLDAGLSLVLNDDLLDQELHPFSISLGFDYRF